MKKRIIFLNNNGFSLYICTGNNVALLGEHQLDQLEKFTQQIQSDPNIDTHIIVDLIDEEFRRELIPHVNYWDRNKAATRRLNYHFPKSDHKNYFFQWREKTGRQDINTLFVSLYNAKILNTCLAILNEYNCPLKGIYSLPLLSRHLLSIAKISHSHVLLVTLQKSSGIRQSFFRYNHLQFSRLSGFAETTDKALEDIIIQEIEKTVNYLQRMKLLGDKHPHIIFISDNSTIGKIKPVKPEHLQIEYRDNTGIASKVKLPHDIHDKYSNFIFIGLFRKVKEANHYANWQERRHHLIKRGKHILHWGSLAACIALFSLGGLNLFKIDKTKQEITSYKKQIENLRTEKHKILSGLPHAPELLQLMAEKHKIQKVVQVNQFFPFAAIQGLTDSVKQFSGVKLNSIYWSIDQTNTQPENIEFIQLPLKRDILYIRVQGELRAENRDFLAVFDKFYAVIAAIKTVTNIDKVEVNRYPLDAHPEQIISGVLQNHTNRQRAEFQLTLTFRTKDTANDIAAF